MPDWRYSKESDVYIFCNACDKIAFDFKQYRITDDIDEVKLELSNPYGKLLEDSERLMTRVQKLFNGNWTAMISISSDYEDPLKNSAGTPLAIKLSALPTIMIVVVTAIKTFRAERKTSSDLAATLSERSKLTLDPKQAAPEIYISMLICVPRFFASRGSVSTVQGIWGLIPNGVGAIVC